MSKSRNTYPVNRKRKVLKTNRKTEIRIKGNIKPMQVAKVELMQRQRVKKFWSKLISQVQDEVKGEQ